MKILKYIKYRMQGMIKLEAYYNMAINNECTFEEYKKVFDRRMKQINKKFKDKEYGNSYKDVTFEEFEEFDVKAGEANVSDKRNSRHKRKANRT